MSPLLVHRQEAIAKPQSSHCAQIKHATKSLHKNPPLTKVVLIKRGVKLVLLADISRNTYPSRSLRKLCWGSGFSKVGAIFARKHSNVPKINTSALYTSDLKQEVHDENSMFLLSENKSIDSTRILFRDAFMINCTYVPNGLVRKFIPLIKCIKNSFILMYLLLHTSIP